VCAAVVFVNCDVIVGLIEREKEREREREK